DIGGRVHFPHQRTTEMRLMEGWEYGQGIYLPAKIQKNSGKCKHFAIFLRSNFYDNRTSTPF
ncbi:MAG: hypothetical protein K2K03_10485, partial [Prevotella sp.]|nr:hypothetical protein [Prevotella sp.]